MTIEIRESQSVERPTPALILRGEPTQKRGEVVVTRAEAVRLLDDLAELAARWR